MAESFTGKVEIQNNESDTTILLDGEIGKVGIGTTSPRAQLTVARPGDYEVLIHDTRNGNRLLIGTDDQLTNFMRLRPLGGDGLAITNNGDRIGLFVRSSDGNVGIGTTRPNEKLDVQGNILVSGDVRLAGADCAEEFEVNATQMEQLLFIPQRLVQSM